MEMQVNLPFFLFCIYSPLPLLSVTKTSTANITPNCVKWPVFSLHSILTNPLCHCFVIAWLVLAMFCLVIAKATVAECYTQTIIHIFFVFALYILDISYILKSFYIYVHILITLYICILCIYT